jgi:type IV secretory pathway component VirB8
MTDSAPSHDQSHEAVEALFPEREWREFRISDAQAAKRIVILMTGIFVLGIVLYSIVVATL